MKTKGDPAYPDYLATYQKITTAMITQMNGANYTYANTSWGEYYYLVALNNFQAHGMLKSYLRNSVNLILPQLNTDGEGFNYGRSIGPYGDSAFMEVLAFPFAARPVFICS